MAPLQRRTADLSLQGTVAVIVLVILFLSGVFCTVIFFKICSKQRRRERAMRKMQEERTPFVGAQYIAPEDTPSNWQESPPTELYGKQQYTGPSELQGAGRPEPMPPQQLDGYAAAASFDDSKPIELPANAMINATNGTGRGLRR